MVRFTRLVIALLVALSILGGGFAALPHQAVAQCTDCNPPPPTDCPPQDCPPPPTQETPQERVQRILAERQEAINARIAEATNRVCSNPNIPSRLLASLGC